MTRNREIFLSFVVLIVGVACAASLARQMGMKASDAAAWAQAIGTVAAILASVAMANRQISAMRREKQTERLEMTSAIEDAARHSLAVWTFIEQFTFSDDIDGLRHAVGVTDMTWATAFNAFLMMPVERWPSPFVYLRAQQFKQAFDLFKDQAWYMAGRKPVEIEWTRLRGYHSRMMAAKSIFDGACEALRERLA